MIPELRQHVRDAARPLVAKYGLSVLPEFADIAAIALLFFTALQADKRTRRNWDMHVVSLTHAFVAVVLASRCLQISSLDEDRAFGAHPDASFLLAIAVGYFVWDTLESIIHFSEVGFVAHGVACLTIFLLTTRPFVQYYAVRFLFWEASTIFLNINWFLDKMGKTGSTLQLANGIALLGTFFCLRLVWGGKLSYDFFVTLNGVYTQLPLLYIIVYGTGNLMLQGLNWFWFMKMVGAIRKRFAGKPIEGKSNGHGVLNGNGTGKIKSHLD